MGGIPWGALSGPLQSPFSSLGRPGTTQSAPSTRSSCRRSQQGSSATQQFRGVIPRVLGDVGPALVFNQAAGSGPPRLNFRENHVDRITRPPGLLEPVLFDLSELEFSSV